MKLAIFCAVMLLAWALFSSFLPSSQKAEKSIIKNCSYVGIAIIVCVYVLSKQGEYLNTLFYIGYALLGIFFIYYLRNEFKKSAQKVKREVALSHNYIKAKKQSYWDIPSTDIINYFKYRREEKKDRVETHVNKLSKNFWRVYDNKHKYFTKNIFVEFNDLELTTLESVDEINNIRLYSKIFNKIKEFTDEAELNINFEEILEENDHIAEYFLIDIWCRFTKRVNIGTANLIVLAQNFTQQELIGALDNADLNSVKRHGSSLYFKYALFKNLIPNEIIEEVDKEFEAKHESAERIRKNNEKIREYEEKNAATEEARALGAMPDYKEQNPYGKSYADAIRRYGEKHYLKYVLFKNAILRDLNEEIDMELEAKRKREELMQDIEDRLREYERMNAADEDLYDRYDYQEDNHSTSDYYQEDSSSSSSGDE